MSIFDQATLLIQQGRAAAAINLVSNAARSGDADGLYIAATWRLWGQFGPRDLTQTHYLLDQASARGHAGAQLLRATLIGNGTGVSADWLKGADLLSKIGSAAAQTQRAILADMHLARDGSPAVALPAAKQISKSPQVAVISGFLSPSECTYLMVTAAPRLEPSTILDRSGQRVAHPVRTSDGTSFGPVHEDLVVRAINRRIAVATGTDVRQGEPLHILRYAPGQQYLPHLDAIKGLENQRTTTVLIYLNDRFQGGETFFPEVKLTIQPRAGDAVIFRNLDPTGRPDMKSEHAGLPVRSGMKWLATRWIRQGHYHPWDLPQEMAG